MEQSGFRPDQEPAYKGTNSKGISLDSDAMLRLYFDPGLAALIIKDRRDANKRGDVPELDGNSVAIEKET